jgi:hypothetical protein
MPSRPSDLDPTGVVIFERRNADILLMHDYLIHVTVLQPVHDVCHSSGSLWLELLNMARTPIHCLSSGWRIAAPSATCLICILLLVQASPSAQTASAKPSMLDKRLISACEHDHLLVVRQFLENGANPNAQGEDHRTPLYWAIHHRNKDMILLLVQNGASAAQPCGDGYTPLTLAAKRGTAEIVRIIQAALAPPEEPKLRRIKKSATVVDPEMDKNARVLFFPDNMNLGTVRVRPRGSTNHRAWKRKCSARAAVVIDADEEVMLIINLGDLSGLDELEPFSVEEIRFNNVRLRREQLQHLYHLKGLRVLSMRNTGVQPSALKALQEALPECKILN